MSGVARCIQPTRTSISTIKTYEYRAKRLIEFNTVPESDHATTNLLRSNFFTSGKDAVFFMLCRQEHEGRREAGICPNSLAGLVGDIICAYHIDARETAYAPNYYVCPGRQFRWPVPHFV